MKHKQFVLEIRPRFKGELASKRRKYRLKILDSPVGYPETEITFPYSSEQVMEILQRLDKLLLQVHEGKEGAVAAGKELLAEQRSLGQELFKTLFSQEIGNALTRSRDVVKALGAQRAEGLRLRLVIDPVEKQLVHLATLPWELLFDGRAHRLACGSKTSLLRYFNNPHIDTHQEIEGPLKVLFVGAEPDTHHATQFEEEFRVLEKVFEGQERIQLHSCLNPSIEQVSDVLRENPCHVVHFYGHGGFNLDTGEGTLAFVKADGGIQRVVGEMVASFLGKHRELRLVVLNTCKGGRLRREWKQHPFAGVAPALIEEGIPGVVAMQFSISIESAKRFSEAFYGQLLQEAPVDVAAAAARQSVLGGAADCPEWATPAVFTGVRDGQLLKWSKVSKAEQEEEAIPKWQIGVRSYPPFKDQGIWGDDMEDKCDEVLDLSEYFEGRKIRRREAWQKAILPRLGEFLYSQVARRRVIRLDFAAHSSIAFAAGYFLEAKSGLKIEVGQRGEEGDVTWWMYEGEAEEGQLWALDSGRYVDSWLNWRRWARVLSGGRFPSVVDTALAAGVTHDVLPDVEVYVKRRGGPQVQRILSASVLPEPGQESVEGGVHSLRLAQQLTRFIRQRTTPERDGVLHLFTAAPNAFVFHLGQLARAFGQVQFYEFPFGEETRIYEPSIRLPFDGRGS